MVDGPPIDIPIFEMYVTDILDKSINSSEDACNESSQNEEPEVQSEKNMVDMGEETKTDEETVITVMKSIARSFADKVKEKMKEKYVPPKISMKNTEIVKEKNSKGKYVTKRRKVESKLVEKKSLKRKFVQSSDYEIDVEEDV